MNRPRGKSVTFMRHVSSECGSKKGNRFEPSSSEIREATNRFLASGGTIEKLIDENVITADVKVPVTGHARAGHGGINGDQEGMEIPRESALDVFGFPSL